MTYHFMAINFDLFFSNEFFQYSKFRLLVFYNENFGRPWGKVKSDERRNGTTQHNLIIKTLGMIRNQLNVISSSSALLIQHNKQHTQ